MHISKVKCSAVQCSAVQCSAMQCSTVLYSAVQCSDVQWSDSGPCGLASGQDLAPRDPPFLHCTAEHCTVHASNYTSHIFYTALHSTAHHTLHLTLFLRCTAEHCTTKHCTTQHHPTLHYFHLCCTALHPTSQGKPAQFSRPSERPIGPGVSPV